MLRGKVWRISQLLEYDASEPIQLEFSFVRQYRAVTLRPDKQNDIGQIAAKSNTE